MDHSRPFAVHGLYDHVAYLRQGERVVALQDESIALTPVSLQLGGRFAFRDRLAADATGRIRDGRLFLGGLAFDFTRAEAVELSLPPCQMPASTARRIPEWHSLVFTTIVDALAEQSIRRRGQLSRTAAVRASDAGQPSSDGPPADPGEPMIGIGDLLLGLSQLQTLPQPAKPSRGVDVRGAFVRQLNRFLETARNRRPDAGSLAGLIGLGHGLTPSGDDFLLGLLSVLWYFESTGFESTGAGRQPSFRQRLCTAVNERLPRTGAVSAAFLREASAGRFSERLCGHFAAFERGVDGRESARRLLALTARSGHCSGTDTLGGMLLGLRLVEAGVPAGRAAIQPDNPV